MKSYLVVLFALIVASGRSLGVWTVERPEPVVVFTGEGKRQSWLRRARHLGQLLGLSSGEVDRLPIQVVDAVASMDSPTFRTTVEDEITTHEPALVIIDPLYTYYGDRAADAGNVFNAGDLLHSVSALTEPRGVALMIVNHFNKAAATKELSLTSITMAGSREWVNNWVLSRHASPPLPSDGLFDIEMLFGGREGYGYFCRVKWELGRFDDDQFEHVGTPKITLDFGSSQGIAWPKGVTPEVGSGVMRFLAQNNQEWLSIKDIRLNTDLPGSPTMRERALHALVEQELVQVNDECRRRDAKQRLGRKFRGFRMVLPYLSDNDNDTTEEHPE